MTSADLDSRILLGTDTARRRRRPTGAYRWSTARPVFSAQVREVRVIVGRLGNTTRLSAPMLDTVVDGADFAEAWGKFVEQLRCRKDMDWLTFDVGPTRHLEIEEGLDAPEDENWGAPFNTGE